MDTIKLIENRLNNNLIEIEKQKEYFLSNFVLSNINYNKIDYKNTTNIIYLHKVLILFYPTDLLFLLFKYKLTIILTIYEQNKKLNNNKLCSLLYMINALIKSL